MIEPYDVSVIGFGGCGSNEISRLIDKESVWHLNYVDRKGTDISKCNLDSKNIFLFEESTTDEEILNWAEYEIYTDYVILFAGLGGMTGTNIIERFAGILKGLEKQVIIVCYTPYRFEAAIRKRKADAKLADLQKSDAVDLLFSLDMDCILNMLGNNLQFQDAMKIASYCLYDLLERTFADKEKCLGKYSVKVSDKAESKYEEKAVNSAVYDSKEYGKYYVYVYEN